MPTEKPRVVTYPYPKLYERLLEYQEAKGFKTLSKAVIKILEEYFEELDMPKTLEKEEDLEEIKRQLDELRGKLERLSEKVKRLEQQNESED
jgi:ubiquinone biosynthesis protein UbiJ